MTNGDASQTSLSPPPSRRRPRKPETECPPTGASDADVLAWALLWKLPIAHPEFDGFLLHHRAKGSLFRDWGAAWGKWTRNAPKFAPASRRTPAVQPTDPQAPWLKDLGT